MTKIFWLIVSTFFLACQHEKKLPSASYEDCLGFKQGTFKSSIDLMPNDTMYFIRKNDIQTEYYINTPNTKTLLEINWLTPCEYELKVIKRVNSKDDNWNIGSKIKVEIIGISNDTCTYKVIGPGVPPFYGWMVKID